MSFKTTINTMVLSEQERVRIAVSASHLNYPETGSYETFLASASTLMGAAYDPSTLAALRRMAGKDGGLTVIANLPFDETVVRGLVDPEIAHAHKPTDLSEVILAGTVKLIGEPYAILQEGRGLISHLSPKPSHLLTDTGLGAIRELSGHIENAAARMLAGDRAPDGLALIGVSKERDTSPGTLVADGRKALAALPRSYETILRDPNRFETRYPERWRASGFPEAVSAPVIIGFGKAMSFVAAMYGGMTIGTDAEAQAVLDAFGTALEAVSVNLYIEPGNLALIGNHVIFHGRRAFQPAFDEAGRPYRFLQRVFWTSSLDRFGDWPRINKRLIEPKP